MRDLAARDYAVLIDCHIRLGSIHSGGGVSRRNGVLMEHVTNEFVLALLQQLVEIGLDERLALNYVVYKCSGREKFRGIYELKLSIALADSNNGRSGFFLSRGYGGQSSFLQELQYIGAGQRNNKKHGDDCEDNENNNGRSRRPHERPRDESLGQCHVPYDLKDAHASEVIQRSSRDSELISSSDTNMMGNQVNTYETVDCNETERDNSRSSSTDNQLEADESHSAMSTGCHYSYQTLREATYNFDNKMRRDGGTLIATGNFGKVYYANLEDQIIAVKRLKAAQSDRKSSQRLSKKQFTNELSTLT